jgi:hypothetical protein
MTTEETLDGMAEAFSKSMDRVSGIGSHQYALDLDTRQGFEDKSQQELLKDTMEEIQDAIAYLAFLHIKIEAMRRWAK